MALRPEFTLEAANQRGAGRLPGLFGFRVTAVSEEQLDAELTVRPEILAPNGYLHAAAVVALADTACGYGCLAHLPQDAASFTTIELKTNFLGTVREGTIGCTARPVHLGRTTHVWDATVFGPDNRRTIALFRCTQMILYKREPVSGRAP
jgi:1,4-dihydroxy-2-naphthoyl-CoA hydrolase